MTVILLLIQLLNIKKAYGKVKKRKTGTARKIYTWMYNNYNNKIDLNSN